jgi:hypothetical protein
MFSVSRQALVNDSTAINLLTEIAQKMKIGAIQRFRAVMLAPLLANSGLGQTMVDGNALFHTAHANLAGTASAITIASVGLGRAAMRKQVDSMGTILALEPAILMVGPDKETEAQQIVAQLYAATVGTVNPFSGTLQVVTDPGLNGNAWYLVADPATARGLSYAWLDGTAGPRVETQPGWNVLGLEFRLTMAVGAAFVETASWYRNAGA